MAKVTEKVADKAKETVSKAKTAVKAAAKKTTKKSGKDKVVLAYSGGLDTTVIIPWLAKTQGFLLLLQQDV